MISYLKGKIIYKNTRSITLLTGGVGYEIYIAQTIWDKLKLDEDQEFFVHLRHTEDNMSLYGFKTREELQFFELLLTVSGIGPKHAIGVLNVARLSDLKKAILRDDPALLYKVSGIGKKIAERIVMELKNKLDALPPTEKEVDFRDTDSEAFDALVGLGYLERDVREVLKSLPGEIDKMEDKIKQALKILGK